ncbi:MAG TPA: glycosyltransferase family 25 protein [Mesorhizobium sp.]|nr:glycosyltransferase family 25 protein [Mesorhizobium sp.]
MQVPVYAINLERSKDRWEALQESAARFGIGLRRIDAVDGRALHAGELAGLDEPGFRRIHGKRVLPAEIGCYFSHLRALDAIAKGAEPYAVVVEDDIVFTPDFLPFLNGLTRLEGWDVVKLVNHRTSLIRHIHRVNSKHGIGRCLHGPLGSSAAYVVTREGAAMLLRALQPMRLPYDVALERGWAGGYEIFTADKAVVGLSGALISTIGGSAAYAHTRLPPWKRLGTLLFRAGDYARRVGYALRRTKIEEARH